uniref:Immunodominant membrane protein n=1 Tax=Elm yellows phytoplasma TaxID=35774 RepID=A0A7U0YCR1_ELYEP|nr:immunodominant membrane protein [Candidatus Phytoplasma ulmi]
MQQKENFLKTKRGKIIVGSVGSVVGLLLLILTICFFMGKWPFSSKITEKDVTDLQASVKKSVETAGKDKDANNKTYDKVKTEITTFETKVKAINEKRADDKKIAMTDIDALKTAVEGLKDKNTEDEFKAAADTFKNAVDKSIGTLKTEITNKNK